MDKLLSIEACRECYNYVEGTCRHSGGMTVRLDSDEIPLWCPLPNEAEPEEEVSEQPRCPHCKVYLNCLHALVAEVARYEVKNFGGNEHDTADWAYQEIIGGTGEPAKYCCPLCGFYIANDFGDAMAIIHNKED